MKTKSGKSHFTVDYKIIQKDGKIRSGTGYKFCSMNAEKYLNEWKQRNEAFGNKMEFSNLVNHDE